MEPHRRLLEAWRTAMDLVGPGPLEPHFEDAAGAVEGLAAAGRWADLGSGAGFPGIALATAFPEAEVWLVESRRKRATFLERVVAEAALTGARVVCDRVEALPSGHFDGVISRAYKPVAAYLTDAQRLLASGGRAVVLIGDGGLVEAPGWVLVERRRYPVGDGFRERVALRRG